MAILELMGFTPDIPLKSFLATLVFQWYKPVNEAAKVRGRLQRTSSKWGGGGGWFWNFGHSRTGGGGVVCESSDVRKFLKKSKLQNFSELFKVKTRNYNRSRFQYESIHIWRLQQTRRQQISLIKILWLHFYSLNVIVFSILNFIKTGIGQ